LHERGGLYVTLYQHQFRTERPASDELTLVEGA
jgi:hypothetical protein